MATVKLTNTLRGLARLFLIAGLLHNSAALANNGTSSNSKPKVVLQTSLGDITLELNAKRAPATVANFLQYVNDGHYNATIFHRVIDGFMIQGGGHTVDMRQKPTRDPIRNEADNRLQNTVGTVAMARVNDPHSARAQFFINVANNGYLNYYAKSAQGWGYAVFGKVVDGMDVVRKIKKVKTGRGRLQDVPVDPVLIKRAYAVTAVPVIEQDSDVLDTQKITLEAPKSELPEPEAPIIAVPQ